MFKRVYSLLSKLSNEYLSRIKFISEDIENTTRFMKVNTLIQYGH